MSESKFLKIRPEVHARLNRIRGHKIMENQTITFSDVIVELLDFFEAQFQPNIIKECNNGESVLKE